MPEKYHEAGDEILYITEYAPWGEVERTQRPVCSCQTAKTSWQSPFWVVRIVPGSSLTKIPYKALLVLTPPPRVSKADTG